jgi:hypothetical protein
VDHFPERLAQRSAGGVELRVRHGRGAAVVARAACMWRRDGPSRPRLESKLSSQSPCGFHFYRASLRSSNVFPKARVSAGRRRSTLRGDKNSTARRCDIGHTA